MTRVWKALDVTPGVNLTAPTVVRILRVKDLPQHPGPRVMLRCSCCGSESSATRGDYFACDPDEDLYCGECTDNEPLRLVREVTTFKVLR